MKQLNIFESALVSGGSDIVLEDGRVAYDDGHGGYMMNRRDAYQLPWDAITTCDMVPVHGPEYNCKPPARKSIFTYLT